MTVSLLPKMEPVRGALQCAYSYCARGSCFWMLTGTARQCATALENERLFVAEVKTVLEVQQADHQPHWQAWTAGRADATAKFAVKPASQIGTNDVLGRLALVGDFRRDDHLDCS